MPLSRLQRTHADHVARNFFTFLIGDRDHNAILATLIAHRMMDRLEVENAMVVQNTAYSKVIERQRMQTAVIRNSSKFL